MPGENRFAREVLAEAVDRGGLCGAVAITGDSQGREDVIALGSTRRGQEGRPIDAATRFDLASLSKVVATLAAVLALLDEAAIKFDDQVKKFFSQAGWFKSPSLADATVAQLLTHTSGLPPWRPLFASASTPQTALAQVLQTGLESPLPIVRYSDLGFIVLGAIVSRVAGAGLDEFCDERVFKPLGMTRTAFGPVPSHEAAATEDCGWRMRLLQGEVHDENAFVLGGVAGHAGLFSTAEDLAKYARAWLALKSPFASEELMRRAVAEHAWYPSSRERRALGWQLNSAGAAVGALASPDAFGHTGFTGTSMWIDRQGGWFTVLLTNRIHPSRHEGVDIQELRIEFHEAIVKDLGVQG